MDEIDRKIICQLQVNARTTLEELSHITGFTSMGIRKRLAKLIESGAIKNQALINPSTFGLTPAMILLEMEDAAAIKDIMNRFRECPRVVHFFKTVGGYNLIALVIAENKDTLESISVEKCSLRSSPGIRRSEFYPISDNEFAQYLQIREALAHKGKDRAPCNVDCCTCARYEAKKCVGCPSTVHYRGTL
jgi:Lrp/AsnC family transcriptional regulator, leucine-responsive regulatory protein